MFPLYAKLFQNSYMQCMIDFVKLLVKNQTKLQNASERINFY